MRLLLQRPKLTYTISLTDAQGHQVWTALLLDRTPQCKCKWMVGNRWRGQALEGPLSLPASCHLPSLPAIDSRGASYSRFRKKAKNLSQEIYGCVPLVSVLAGRNVRGSQYCALVSESTWCHPGSVKWQVATLVPTKLCYNFPLWAATRQMSKPYPNQPDNHLYQTSHYDNICTCISLYFITPHPAPKCWEDSLVTLSDTVLVLNACQCLTGQVILIAIR